MLIMNVNQERTNKLLAYASIFTIVVESLLVYFTNFSVKETLIVSGIAVAMFSPPLTVYFIKPPSRVFKYLFTFFAVTYMFIILYIQKGNIDNLFLLFVILSGASLYFDIAFTLYTTGVLCMEALLGLLFFRETLYPLLAPAGVGSLVVCFLVIGFLLAFQGEWGKKMMSNYEAVYDKSITDFLTQARNRAFFDDYLHDTIIQSKKYGEKFCIVMLDIDNFKTFNDKYGHPVGDLVLQKTCRTIQDIIRKTDILSRFGGEEFTVICKAASIEDGLIIAEKIRAGVDGNTVIHEGKELHLTVSVGVTEFSGRDNVSTLTKRVDDALLKAKQNGKNRVEYLQYTD